MAAPDTADDAMLARMLMMEEQAAADERGLDYSPTFRKRRLSDESEDYDPGSKRRAKPKPKPKPKPEPEPEPKPEPKPEPETVPSASEANPPEPRGKPKPPAAPRGVTLAHLIDAGLLLPGPGALSTSYEEAKTKTRVDARGDLLPDGSIDWNGVNYVSVSAFSLAVKRSVNPGRKADDGWKCVRFRDEILDAVKRRHEATRRDGDDDAPVKPGGAVAAVAAREAAAREAAAKRRQANRPPPKPKPPPQPQPPPKPKPQLQYNFNNISYITKLLKSFKISKMSFKKYICFFGMNKVCFLYPE